MSSIPEFIGPVQPLSRNPRFQNLIGERFGRLTVIAYGGREGLAKWHCYCDCGNGLHVFAGALKRKLTRSCGCYNKEVAAERQRKHSGKGTPEYHAWKGIKQRCFNPNNNRYSTYGARGITICSRWLGDDGFANFFADMGPRPTSKHSIDRIDNDKGYSPDNCRWTTNIEQARNRTSNWRATFHGTTKVVKEWADLIGVNPGSVYGRIRKGDSPLDALLHFGLNRLNINE